MDCGSTRRGQAFPASFLFDLCISITLLRRSSSLSASTISMLLQTARLWRHRSTLNHRYALLLPARRPGFHFQPTRLSTHNGNASTKAHLPKPASSASSPQNPSLPAFSFQDLGANGATKIVVITCLAVAATAESIFWVKVFWAKVSRSRDPESEPEAN